MAGTRVPDLVTADARRDAFAGGVVAGFGLGVVFACWVVLRK